MKILIVLVCLIVSFNAYPNKKYYKELCITTATLINIENLSKTGKPSFSLEIKELCDLVDAIMLQESSYRKNAFNKEKSGSYGLLQIQCDTAKLLGLRDNCKTLYWPSINIYYGLKLIEHLMTRYEKLDDIIASYNAGRVIYQNNRYINSKYVTEVKDKLNL